MPSSEPYARVSSGVPGLDEILHGGYPQGGVYLLQGGAGTGKTTVGLQFLRDGVERDETALFVSLAQPRETLERIAASHGWSLDGIEVRSLTPRQLMHDQGERQDVFLPEDVELIQFTQQLEDLVRDVDPDRIVVDSLTMLQMLSSQQVRYRQELIALVDFLREHKATAILTLATDGEFFANDAEASSDGIIRLHETESEYGEKRFRLIVRKLRASAYRGGFQDFAIVTGGVRAFPRIVPLTAGKVEPRERFSSGSEELDSLVGGGLAAGTSTLIVGPSGTGKTSLATKYVHAAAQRGQKSVMFLFEEVREMFLTRASDLGMELSSAIEDGTVVVQQVEGALISPGEFSVMVRDAVSDDMSIVVIDSLTGYFQSMRKEDTLIAQIRDLIRYLSRKEVQTILTVAQRGMVGTALQSPLDISESADTTMLVRYFELRGELRKAISVIKKRYGEHATDIRELTLSERGVNVGKATHNFSGILSGSPRFVGNKHDHTDADAGE